MLKTSTKIMFSVLLSIAILMLTACGGTKQTSGSGSEGKQNQTAAKTENAKADNGKKSENVKFPVKEIRYIVPVSPGGGMDTQARILARYLEEKLGTKVIVENIPGAEYNSGIFAMLKEKADGHTVIQLPGVIINQLLSDVNYDLKQFDWIGRISESSQVAVVSKKSGIKDLKGLQKLETVKAAVTGLSSSQTVGQLISAKEMGFKVRPIGHKGASEAILSVIRGDADWTTAPEITMMPYVKNGDVIPLWVASDKRLPNLPNTPTLIELGYPQLNKIVAFDRIVAAKPGTPPEVLKKLRDTFKAALADPRLIEEMKKLGDVPSYLPGEATAVKVKDALDLIKPHVDYLKTFKK